MKKLSPLQKLRLDFDNIQHLATILVKTESSEETREIIVSECQAILKADAVCLYLLQPQGYYEMIAERGCTQQFKEQCYRLYKEHLPTLFQAPADNATSSVSYESRADFKANFPTARKLVDASARKTLAHAPLIVNQKTVGLFGFSYNSEQKPAEKQFLETIVNLCAQALERARLFELERLARKEAELASRAKTDFLSNISHEIRTPINAIKGFAELIYKSDGLTFNQKDWTSRVLKNAEHLNELIGDVLDVSKIEAHKVDVYRHMFSLNEFIDDVKAITVFKAEEKGIELKFEVLCSNVVIHSDATLLRQILVNLITNAIKFTSKNGKVEVYIEFKNSKLRFEVVDTGIGIARKDQERIFERFSRVNLDIKKSVIGAGGGTGLGLFISKRLAMALGGDLNLQESAPGRGSVFVAETRCGVAKTSAGKTKPRALGGSKKLQGLNFLLVDDSIDNQVLVKHVLSQEGAIIDTADNGMAGVEKALKTDYQVVIMDIQMPELDGNEAVSQLRLGGYRKPIVALTAEVLTSQKQHSLQRGFDEYLPKPINHELLIKTLVRLANQPLIT